MTGTQINQIRGLTKQDFGMLLEMCRRANSLSNSAEWHIRHFFERTGRHLSYAKNCKISKHNYNYKMLHANVAQQTLRRRDAMYTSYFGLLKAKKAGTYHEDVHRPSYRKKGGYDSIIIPGKYVIMRGDRFAVPTSREFRKKHDNHEVLIPVPERLRNLKIRQVEIRPASDGSYLEAVFTYDIPEENKGLDQNNVLGIDPGVDNLAACAASDGATFIVDGRPLKSVNHHWNKRMAAEKSRLETENNQRWSRLLTSITHKRNNQVRDYMRKAAKAIVDFAIAHNCGTIVFGHNKGQKQNCEMDHVNTQNFVQIPIGMLRQMVAAKCGRYGIRFVEQDESYTSKASALDGDFIPTWQEYENPEDRPKYVFAGRRVKRGLYRAADGTVLNADINGALNIARKCKQNESGYSDLRLCMGGLNPPARIRFRK